MSLQRQRQFQPAKLTGDGPWCCSIACYRSFSGIDDPERPSCHDGVTTTCPICQRQFRPVGRRAYCSILLGREEKDLLRAPVVCDRRS